MRPFSEQLKRSFRIVYLGVVDVVDDGDVTLENGAAEFGDVVEDVTR